MSVSMGLAAILPTDDMNMDWYCHQAEQGLYEARQEGKNRVGLFEKTIFPKKKNGM